MTKEKFFVKQTPTNLSDTRILSARPELQFYRGYDCVRTSNQMLQVWRTVACGHCQTALRVHSTFVRSDAGDTILERHGMNLWTGPIPEGAVYTHTGGEYLCPVDHKRWLAGEALETLGETTTRVLKI